MDNEGTTVLDGQHDLHIYKCDDFSRLRNPNSYLHLKNCSCPSHSLSSGTKCIAVGNQFQKSQKESVSISTMLVSTKLTQNSKLVLYSVRVRLKFLSSQFCLLTYGLIFQWTW